MNDDLLVVRSRRLCIRRKRREDAPNDYRWRRDPEVVRYDGAEPITLSFQEYLDLYDTELSYVDARRQVFAIETTEGEHIGNVMFYNADHGELHAEIGISIGELAYREQGYGSEALVAFVYYLWNSHPFRTLRLHSFEWNERARRSFERAGFQWAGVVHRAQQELVRMEARREYWLMEFEAGKLPRGRSDAQQKKSTGA